MARSKTFCIVPWVQLATNATGNYRVCCNALPGKNLIRTKSGKPMRIAEHSVQEVWRSNTYKEMREQFLRGERPEMCGRCFREEDSGVKSARQNWNEKWSSEEEDNALPAEDIKYIDLRLGNLCNLKCRMCNPYASSKWVDEWNTVAETASLVPNFKLDKAEAKRLKRINWPNEDSTWEHLTDVLATVEEIYLTGGEPFLSLKQIHFLTQLVEKGTAQRIKLKYNTNLTYLPEELVSIWPHFKKVTLNVSVDGVGPLDEYIRHPTNWKTVEENLNQLLILENEIPSLQLGIHTTVQMYNILHLGDILSYFDRTYKKMPYLNILNHPSCLNIRVLPHALKEMVEKRLAEWAEKKEVREVIRYMNKEHWFDKFFGEFSSYTKALDQSRNQNLLKLNPEFQDHYLRHQHGYNHGW